MATKLYNLGIVKELSLEEVIAPNGARIADLEKAIAEAAERAGRANEASNARAFSVFSFEGKLYVAVGSGAYL